jgi:transposase
VAHWTKEEKARFIVAARKSGNVPAFCRRRGIGLRTYYRWERLVALAPRGRKLEALARQRGPREMTAQQEQMILDLADRHPEWSRLRVARAVGVSESGVYAVWEREGIPTSINQREWLRANERK